VSRAPLNPCGNGASKAQGGTNAGALHVAVAAGSVGIIANGVLCGVHGLGAVSTGGWVMNVIRSLVATQAY